jgi:restriction system protein
VFERDHADLCKQCEKIDEYNARVAKLYSDALVQWNEKQEASHALNAEYVNEFERFCIDLKLGEESKVLGYFSRILDNVPLPDPLECDYDLGYDREAKILAVDFNLPDIDELPNAKDVSYVSKSNKFEESVIFLQEVYDDLIYRLSLGLIYVIFWNDSFDLVESAMLVRLTHTPPRGSVCL